jgi:glycosyltransferase involved in cell wall biosynthesis
MRILVVSHGFPPRGRYGTEFYTRELALGLAARGHEVQVLHPLADGSRPRYDLEEVEEEGLRVTLLHNPGDASKRFEPSYLDARVEARFDELLERERPDLVHFTYLLWGLSVRLPAVARARGLPSVVTLTDYGLLCHRGQMFDFHLRRCGGPHPADVCARCIREPGAHDLPPAKLALKRAAVRLLAAVGGAGRVVVRADVERRERAVREALDAAAALIAPTHGLANAFRAFGVPDAKLTELVYAFDEAPYVAVRGTPAPSPPRFGFLAQFGPHKGLDTLLAAARELHARAPERPWKLVLHGASVPGRHALFPERVLARRIDSRVELGQAFEPEEAPRVLAGFSAIVLPAAWDENAPLSVLQARTVGVPVLGTDVPGIAEVLAPEAAARLVPVGDASALADRMQDVLDGRVGRAAEPGLPLGLAAHLDRIESLYSRIRETLG